MELLYLVVGIGLGYLIFRPKETEKEKAPLPFSKDEEEEELDPMTLRNDFGVYRGEKPTFAEQWANIMNFSGESQTEEEYEETEENYTPGGME